MLTVNIVERDKATVKLKGEKVVINSGDMLKAVYDPQLRETDIFGYVDEHTKELSPIDIDILLGV